MRRYKQLLSCVLTVVFVFSFLLAGCEEPATETTTTTTEAVSMNAYHKTDPSADDTLYILTAAASNSHYFTDELYGILAAAGVKAKVCNLMKSSTGIHAFYDHWLP